MKKLISAIYLKKKSRLRKEFLIQRSNPVFKEPGTFSKSGLRIVAKIHSVNMLHPTVKKGATVSASFLNSPVNNVEKQRVIKP